MTLPRLAPDPRPRAAELDDVPEMAELINGFAALGRMLPKASEDLCRHIREYRVVRDSRGDFLGCGGLRVYSPELAEIVGLAVTPVAHGRGVGRALVESLLDEAAALGVARIFAMTLEPAFFERLDFRAVSMAILPEKHRADCRSCARRAGCREIAMQRVLRPGARETRAAPAVEAPRPARGRLRVLTGFTQNE